MTDITVSRELLRQVLEALDLAQALLEKSSHHGTTLSAYNALRAALEQTAPVQEPQPVAYLMKHGQWSTNIETDEGMWLLEQFPSEDVQIPVYLAAQSPQGCEADSLHSRK